MAFNGKLVIDDKEYTLLNWNIRVSQTVDETGRPIANPQGGLLSLTINSVGNHDFFEWATSPDMTKSGEIKFQRTDNTASLKTYEFKNAYCIDFYEEFDSVGAAPMTMNLIISSEELKSGSAPFKKYWNKKSN